MLFLMESETAHIWKKLYWQQILSRFINYFTFNGFLFAGDDVKRMIQGYISVKCFDINVNRKSFWKKSSQTYKYFNTKSSTLHCTLRSVIYLLERINFLN